MDAASAWIVGLGVGAALAFGVAYVVRRRRHERRSLEALRATGDRLPRSLHPVIDPDVCIGSLSCIRACPEGDILGIVDGASRLIHGEHCIGHGRCAAEVRSPELGTRFEAETRALAGVGGAFDLSGSLRLGFGGDAQAPGNVDAARLEVSTRPVRQVRLAAWLAYDGLEVPSDAEPMVYPGHARRAEGSATFEPVQNVRLTLLGGTAADLTSRLDRSWVGPIVDLPRVLLGYGGLSAGYLEEMGWSDGRSAWVQAVGRLGSRLRLLARFTWSHASSLALTQDELGAALGMVADLTDVFVLRLSVSARTALTGAAGSTQGGGTAFATLAARY